MLEPIPTHGGSMFSSLLTLRLQAQGKCSLLGLGEAQVKQPYFHTNGLAQRSGGFSLTAVEGLTHVRHAMNSCSCPLPSPCSKEFPTEASS